jgi:hypothetical protein
VNKDAQLIAEAYEQVLEGNFGKALKSLGAAAALATTGYAADPDTADPAAGRAPAPRFPVGS